MPPTAGIRRAAAARAADPIRVIEQPGTCLHCCPLDGTAGYRVVVKA